MFRKELIEAMQRKGFLDAIDLTVKLIDSGELDGLRSELLAIKNQLTGGVLVETIMTQYGLYPLRMYGEDEEREDPKRDNL